MIDSKSSRISPTLLLLISIALIFIFTRNYIPLYNITQNEYYAHAFANAHEDLLQNDWFVHTQLKHIVFSWMVEGLFRLNIVQQGTHIIQVILEAIFYISSFYIVQSIFVVIKKRNKKFEPFDVNLLSLVSVLILLIIHNSFVLVGLANRFNAFITDAHLLWREFSNFSGFAVQVMNGGYLQPSEFGILFLPAIALALRSRWRIATVLLAIVVNFHFSYSIHCGVFLLAFIAFLAYEKRWRLIVEISFIFGLLVLPITLYAVSFLGDPQSSFAAEIFAVEMFPFHSLPSVFWSRPQQMNNLKMATIIVGMLLCWRFELYRLLGVLLSGFILVTVSLIYVFLSSNYSVAILFPWRASVFLVPLATIIIIAFIVWGIRLLLNDSLLNQRSFKVLLTIGLVAIVVAEGFMFMRWTIIGVDNTNGAIRPQVIYNGLRDATEPDDIILIPTVYDDDGFLPSRFWSGARLGMQRAIYVDSFSFPMLGKDVAEFWDRLQFVESFYQQPLQTQLELCSETGVDYFVSYEVDPPLNVTPVFEIGPVYLYRCES